MGTKHTQFCKSRKAFCSKIQGLILITTAVHSDLLLVYSLPQEGSLGITSSQMLLTTISFEPLTIFFCAIQLPAGKTEGPLNTVRLSQNQQYPSTVEMSPLGHSPK
jgi:hypothetical protein